MLPILPPELVDLILELSIQSDIVTNVAQAATLCRLSRFHKAQYTKLLYRHVILLDRKSQQSFRNSVTQDPSLGAMVSTLVILPHSTTPADPAADRILSACSNVSHLLLSRQCFFDWSPGLFRLVWPREVTLVGVQSASDLDGFATRHRELMTRVLENDPQVQSALRAGVSVDDNGFPIPLSIPDAPSDPIIQSSFMMQSSPKSLSHLHLVQSDGHLLHHLAPLSSLTHVVLTNPIAGPRGRATPTLVIIPRAHLLLLLASGHIARLVIRADIQTCITIMEQVMPIDDAKLLFRPIRSTKDPLFRVSAPPSFIREVDSISEFIDRVRLDVVTQERSNARSSSDAGTSRGSTGTYSTSEEEDRVDHDADDDDSNDISEGSPRPSLARFSSTATTTTNAPPPRIPIEELLRHETFPLQQAHSNYTSDPSTSISSRQKVRSRRGPFAAQRHDLRGATQANLDHLARLYDTLAAEAGIEQEMQFW